MAPYTLYDGLMPHLRATTPSLSRRARKSVRTVANKRYNQPPPPYSGPLEMEPEAAPAETRRRFENRVHAGHLLAEALSAFKWRNEPIILAIPRGGVIVAAEVARRLGLPLDVWLCGDLQPRGVMHSVGFVSEDGDIQIDDAAAAKSGVPPLVLIEETRHRRSEVQMRSILYRAGGKRADLYARTVILIDDGVATGAAMTRAVLGVARSQPAELYVAAPVAPLAQEKRFSAFASRALFLETPEDFGAIADSYLEFEKVGDDDVVRALAGLIP